MSAPWFVSVELDQRAGTAQSEVHLGEMLVAPGLALLDRAQRRGLQTAVLTQAPPQDSAGEDWLIDRWAACDTSDPAAVVAAARALGGRVAAVVGGSAAAVRSAASVARMLDLRGPDPHAQALACSSAAQRAAQGDGRFTPPSDVQLRAKLHRLRHISRTSPGCTGAGSIRRRAGASAGSRCP